MEICPLFLTYHNKEQCSTRSGTLGSTKKSPGILKIHQFLNINAHADIQTSHSSPKSPNMQQNV